MTEALDLTAPPVEAHVWDQIKTLPGVTCFTVDQQESPSFLRRVWTFQVDTRGATRQAAGEVAEQARRAVLALPSVAWNDGVVIGTAVVSGHSWLPDENGAPRYVARYEVVVRPRA